LRIRADTDYNAHQGWSLLWGAKDGLPVQKMNGILVPCPLAGVVDCEAEVQAATSIVFYLRNRKKQRNFIMADITGSGYFHFYVENLPKDKTGCPGWWLLQMAWDFFVQDQKVVIKGVRGDWTSGDNLDTVNNLTAGNKMTLEEAARRTWTYQQVKGKGFTKYQYLDAQGNPGHYTSVDVVFLP
jgi:hypothetical protein